METDNESIDIDSIKRALLRPQEVGFGSCPNPGHFWTLKANDRAIFDA
jgi:hypothetical protein